MWARLGTKKLGLQRRPPRGLVAAASLQRGGDLVDGGAHERRDGQRRQRGAHDARRNNRGIAAARGGTARLLI